MPLAAARKGSEMDKGALGRGAKRSIGKRNGSSTTETEYFTYTGNKRSGWNYDANGNAYPDQPDEEFPIQIEYNLINLPSRISAEELLATTQYLADGTKIATLEGYVSGGFYYIGPFRYYTDELEILDVKVAGGRAVTTRAGWAMRYYTTDHLGSTRLITDGSGAIIRQYDYLPYGEKCYNTGLAFGYSGNTDYLYCGKEWLEFFGIDWYDSKYRYLSTEGIFTSIDPLAEKYPGISPYAYCAGDPVCKVDFDGQDEWEINSQGKVVNQIKNNETDVFYFVDNDGNRFVANDGESCSISFGAHTFSYAEDGFKTAFFSNNAQAGATLFKFLADFTNVEQGLIIGNFGAFVFNEGTESDIQLTRMAQDMNKRHGVSLSKLIHSHPGNSQPSNEESRGDIHAANKVLSYVPRYVYLPAKNKLIPYNGKGSGAPIPWKAVFPSSNY